MKKGKICSKLKKILITIMCVITLVFSMPVKAKADIIEDFIDLLLRIPDGVMWIGNIYLSGRKDEDSQMNLNFKGVFVDGDDGRLYNFYVTPYDIFTTGEVRSYLDSYQREHSYRNLPIFYANFFNIDDGKIAENDSYALKSNEILRPVIGNTYKYLRNLCIVLMMLVLLYIGIRIIVSSAASDQSKYKKMLMDWLVGLCLLFVMHYIMSFIMNFNDIVVDMLQNNESSAYYISLPSKGNGSGWGEEWYEYFDDHKGSPFVDLHLDIPGNANESENGDWENSGFLFWKKSGAEDDAAKQFSFNESERTIKVDTHTDWGDDGLVRINAVFSTESGKSHVCVYRANLMEYVRTLSAYGTRFLTVYADNNIEAKPTGDDEEAGWQQTMGYGILYLALVVESVMFSVIYMKRVLQLAFLTMIAPIVAFMYPLDKIGDGSAQSFNGWLKDYIFNVLLQPLHLLLYTIFITAAMDLFSKNVIYALAVYAFMIPAEKYFKKVFGFDKASGSPPGGMAGALGGAMAMRGFDKLAGLGPHSKGKGGPSGGDKGTKGIKIKKDKLEEPKSPSRDNPEGILSGSNVAALNRSAPRANGNVSSANRNSSSVNRNTPRANVSEQSRIKRAGNFAKNLAKSGGKVAGRRITRAVSGKDSLKGLSGAAKVAAIGGTLGKKVGRLGGRAAGVIGLGAAGVMAGAATAMATGDLNNLTKGAAAGLTAGWTRGGQFGDLVNDKVGGIVNDTSAELANLDKGHKARILADRAIEQLEPEDRTKDRINALNEYARYMDFDGKDSIDAIIEADELAGGDAYQAMAYHKEADNFPDLRIDKNAESYKKYKTNELLEKGKITVSDDEIMQADREDMIKKERENYAEKIKKAEEENNTAEVENLRKEQEAKIKEIQEENLKDYYTKEEMNQRRQELAQRKAQDQVERDYRNTLEVQKVLKGWE